MAYQFIDPDVASIRVPIYTNANGDIAIEGDDTAGSKNMTFSYTKVDATAQEIIFGSTGEESEASTTGIITTFITYLLGASYNALGIKRTLVQNTTRAEV